jgi:endonuclease/exonuclease/phosphatase (EEP) superfamily protein YafD
MASISELQAELAAVKEAIANTLANGAAYGVTNSHNVTSAPLDQLRKQQQLIERRIFKLSGYTGRNYAQFE